MNLNTKSISRGNSQSPQKSDPACAVSDMPVS